jgi:hypothetical protein
VTPSRSQRARKPGTERAWPAETTKERLERCHAMLRLHPSCTANGCPRVQGIDDGKPACMAGCFMAKGINPLPVPRRALNKEKR